MRAFCHRCAYVIQPMTYRNEHFLPPSIQKLAEFRPLSAKEQKDETQRSDQMNLLTCFFAFKLRIGGNGDGLDRIMHEWQAK